MRPYRILTVMLALLLCNYVAKATNGDVSLDTVPNYNGWGWDALVVDNGIIQLVIIPDIGGRVMFYGFEGDEYLAINDDQVGNNYEPSTNSYGPWTSWGYGGYKCWPAPQSVWNWPPPPYLDWGNYTYTTEHTSADSVVIYLESEVESNTSANFANVVGLQQARRFSIYKNSSKVAVEEILKNVSCNSSEWSIWEVSQVWPNHGTGDNSNISTYFHATASDVKKLQSGDITTTAVNDTIRKYNENNSGKIGMLVNPGWCCYVDERDSQAYAKIFNVYPNESYPDQNTTLQFYAGGTYTEIEVLSPIYDISQGSSVSFTEYWYASHTKGAMQNINHAGAVLSPLLIDNGSDIVEGSYGIYNTGKLKLVFSDNGSELMTIDTFTVSAAEKYDLSVDTDVPVGTTRLDLIAYDVNDNLVDTLDTWLPGNNVSIEGITENLSINIYPSVTSAGSVVDIQFNQIASQSLVISLYSLNGQLVNTQNYADVYLSNHLKYQVPQLSSGIYILSMRTGKSSINSKLIVK